MARPAHPWGAVEELAARTWLVVPVAEMRESHLRQFSTHDDERIERCLRTAEDALVSIGGLYIADQNVRARLAGFPLNILELHVGWIRDVVEVSYYDTAGTRLQVNAAHYRLLQYRRPPALELTTGNQWPATEAREQAVEIDLSVGWPTADAVPEAVRTAVKLTAAHYYRNPSAYLDEPGKPMGFSPPELPAGVDALIRPWAPPALRPY